MEVNVTFAPKDMGLPPVLQGQKIKARAPLGTLLRDTQTIIDMTRSLLACPADLQEANHG